MTEAEQLLWRFLRNRNLANAKFRRQVSIGPFIADFLCFEHRLVVEVDGSQHAGSAADAARDAYLQAEGFRILRFWNNEVLSNTEGVLAVIAAALGNTPHPAAETRPPSPARGEGLEPGAPPLALSGESKAKTAFLRTARKNWARKPKT